MTKQLDLVQDSLIGAIKRLLHKKDFNEISISELTRVAGISRPTFYRHYHNIVDILNIETKNLLTEFLSQVKYQDKDNYQYILNTISFFEEHESTINIILDTKHQELLQQNIALVLGQLSTGKIQNAYFSAIENRYYVMYHTAGLMAVIFDWIQNNKPISAQQLAKFLDKNSTNTAN